MDIVTLKKAIDCECKLPLPLVFIYKDNPFVCTQYINQYVEYMNESVENVDSIEGNATNLWGDSDLLKVFYTDKISMGELPEEDKLIVVCKKVDKVTDDCIEFPSLTDENVRDYAYYLLEGVDAKYIEWFLKICHNDIYRVEKESQKLLLFPKTKRNAIFKYMSEHNSFSDLTEFSIFDISNAILTKDVKKLSEIYEQIENIDVSTFALLSLLHSNFRGIIDIQIGGLSAEESGLTIPKYRALSKMTRYYSKDQLLKVYELITSIDSLIKNGELPQEIAVDYLILNILSIERNL